MAMFRRITVSYFNLLVHNWSRKSWCWVNRPEDLQFEAHYSTAALCPPEGRPHFSVSILSSASGPVKEWIQFLTFLYTHDRVMWISQNTFSFCAIWCHLMLLQSAYTYSSMWIPFLLDGCSLDWRTTWYLKCRLAMLEYLGGSCSFSLQIIFLWNLNPFVFTMSQDPCNPVQLCQVGQMWHTTKLWNSIPWEQMSHTVLHKAVLHMKLWEWVSSTLILALSSPFLMHCFVQ